MGTGVPKRGQGTFAILVTFAVVCPPTAVLAFTGLVALSDMAMQRFSSLQFREVVWFDLLYGIPFGYFFLVWPAALAGFVIARWQAVKGRVPWWLPLAIGVLAGAVVQLALGLGMHPGRDSATYLPGEELIPTAAFAIAIMVGWGIVRSWYVPPPPAGATP